MTRKQILQEITNNFRQYGYFRDFVIENGSITEYDELGGEGDGAPISIILQVTSKDVGDFLVRIDGFFNSWDSSEFHNDAYIVIKYEKMVVDYKKEE